MIFLNNTKLKPLFILAVNNRSKAFVQPISIGNRSSEDYVLKYLFCLLEMFLLDV